MSKEEFYIPEMPSFNFNSVKRIMFGIDVHKKLNETLKAMNVTRPLIITDKGIVQSGILEKVKNAAEGNGVKTKIWDNVVIEPTLESMEAVKDYVRENDFDLIIGLGGGSSMDTAKIAALMCHNPGNVIDYFKKKFEKPRLPLILIPTTSGTGAEVTGDIVFSVSKEKRWYSDTKALPDIALVDPVLTISVPPRVTAYTGLDALAHAVEALMTIYATPLSDAFAYQSIKWVIDYLEKAFHQGKDIKARYYMSLAATTAGWVNQNVPATLSHSVGYTLTNRYGIPHGASCGIPLPYCMRYNLSMCVDKFAVIGGYFGIVSDNKRDMAFKAIEGVRRIIADVDMPTSLKELEVPKEDLPALAKEFVEKYPRPYNLVKMDLPKAEKLYKHMWEGALW